MTGVIDLISSKFIGECIICCMNSTGKHAKGIVCLIPIGFKFIIKKKTCMENLLKVCG